MSAWSACGQPRCRAHALLPLDVARDVGPALQTDPLGLDRRPDVDEGVADDQHVRRRPTGVGDPALLRARHQVVDQHPDLARRARAERRRAPRRGGRRPRGSSTTTPSMRRSSPQTFSTSSASCRPSTKIRLARATRAARAGDGDASRRRCGSAAAGAAACTGAARMTGLPSSRNPGPSGKVRRRPRRSSRVRVCRSRSTATISPTQSVVTSSTTAPSSAGRLDRAAALGRAPVTGRGRRCRIDRSTTPTLGARRPSVRRSGAPSRRRSSPRPVGVLVALRVGGLAAGRAGRRRSRRRRVPRPAGCPRSGTRSSGSWSSLMPVSGSSSESLMAADRYPAPQISGSRFWLRGSCS